MGRCEIAACQGASEYGVDEGRKWEIAKVSRWEAISKVSLRGLHRGSSMAQLPLVAGSAHGYQSRHHLLSHVRHSSDWDLGLFGAHRRSEDASNCGIVRIVQYPRPGFAHFQFFPGTVSRQAGGGEFNACRNA